ncbi:MAG TPA: FHA domain-containing protein [Gemmataceae bacterium]|jgi:pSer/pThr/pTyr-binding forkhead associated (FHA) protein|nr:FHA domain-containing protein [Gemmataceae bacterium]
MERPKVIVHVPLPGQEDSEFVFDYVFDCPQICLVGCADDSDIRILEGPGQREISPLHCLLEIDAPMVRLYDLGSENGTYVNGQRLEPITDPTDLPHAAAAELKDGDEIRIADTTLHVLIGINIEAMEPAQPALA